jgi:hypothetical protein
MDGLSLYVLFPLALHTFSHHLVNYKKFNLLFIVFLILLCYNYLTKKFNKVYKMSKQLISYLDLTIIFKGNNLIIIK